MTTALAALFLIGGQQAGAQQVGANVPFVTFEAENGAVSGGAAKRYLSAPAQSSLSTPELEASGRAFVELTGTGQAVTFTNNTSRTFTTLNLRFSIPDAPTGGGQSHTLNLYVDGTFRQSISLSSKQTWLYEGNQWNGMSQNPSVGNPHLFFDEAHLWINGTPVGPGSQVTLKKDSGNQAAFYWIDLIDLENPPAPISQPANSLSVTSYGAVPNDNGDDTQAIRDCINAATAQGKSVWIPQGNFRVNETTLSASGITIEGAGIWYTKVYRDLPNPFPIPQNVRTMWYLTGCTVKNFSIDSTSTARTAAEGCAGALDMAGNGWRVENMWVQHTSSGVWAKGSNGIIRNCRMLNTWGDGLNLNNGNTGNIGNNLLAEHNFVRGAGDDGVTINSDVTSVQMDTVTLRNNTSIAVWWADGLRVAGGRNVLVENNLIVDTVKFPGIIVGTFNGADLESAVIRNNHVIRCGGRAYNQYKSAFDIGRDSSSAPYVKNILVHNNQIIDSMERGMKLSSAHSVFIENNLIDGLYQGSVPANSYAIGISSSSMGNSVLNDNTVQNISGVPDLFANDASYANYKIGGIGNVGITVANPTPAPWVGQDIGPVGSAGGDSYEGDTFAVVGAGNDIWNTADRFRFVHRPASGDVEIRAYVHSVKKVDPWSKVGLMIRESLSDNARNVFLALTPSNGIRLQARSTAGGSTAVHGSVASLTAPYWLRIVRSGNLFTGYRSTDGVNWSVVGSQTIAMNANVRIGMAVTSLSSGSRCSALFEGVSTVPLGGVVSLRANNNNQWVCADNSGNSPLIANRPSAGAWERFTVVDMSATYGPGHVALLANVNQRYVTAGPGGNSSLIASSATVNPTEVFFWKDRGDGSVSLLSYANGLWVCAESNGAAPLIANRPNDGAWERFFTKTW